MENRRYQHNLGRIENYFRIDTSVAVCNEESQIASPMTKLARRTEALKTLISRRKIVIHNSCNRSRIENGKSGQAFNR